MNAKDAIIPARGYLLVEIIDEDSVGSFTVHEEGKIPQWGKVLWVGLPIMHESGVGEVNPPASVGDVVIHSAYGFENIRYKGVMYRIVPFSKVLAVVKEDK